jgi:2-alkenal reductase
MKNKRFTILVVVAVLIGLLFGNFAQVTEEAGIGSAFAQDGDDEENLIAEIYRRVSPSVVYIRTVRDVNISESMFEFDFPDELPEEFEDMFPEDEEGEMPDTFPQQAEGSGFVLDKTGHIVTNAHVVSGSRKIEVQFFDGTFARGEIVGADDHSDIAVIKVDVPEDLLFPVTLADSDEVFVGQRAIAIGNPFGQNWTVTTGIVSAISRTIPAATQFSIPSVIQTDAAINPGNSGGPLLNRAGEVIGVNTQIRTQTTSSAGVGFAVPSNLVHKAAYDLIELGQVKYAWLGISGRTLNLDIIEAMELPQTITGALVSEVDPNGPAGEAGLQGYTDQTEIDGIPYWLGGDIIMGFNDKNVTSMDDVIRFVVEEVEPGDTATLTIYRDGETMEVEITFAARPDSVE